MMWLLKCQVNDSFDMQIEYTKPHFRRAAATLPKKSTGNRAESGFLVFGLTDLIVFGVCKLIKTN